MPLRACRTPSRFVILLVSVNTVVMLPVVVVLRAAIAIVEVLNNTIELGTPERAPELTAVGMLGPRFHILALHEAANVSAILIFILLFFYVQVTGPIRSAEPEGLLLEIAHSGVQQLVEGVLLVQLVGRLGLQVLHDQVFVVAVV